MGILRVLMPYNFSVRDSKALDFVVDAFAQRKDVKITIFHSYVPLPELDLQGSALMKKMSSGLLYLEEELRGRESGLKRARTYLLENGFAEDQVDYVFKEREKGVAEDIIDMVLEGHYKVLVLRLTAGKVGRMFTRGICDKVLKGLKDVIICIPT